ncbi:hypothetical protein BROUX41_006771 [Berkeleyomyces rouxiae]
MPITPGALIPPNITLSELKQFHDELFSPASVAAFGADFVPPKPQMGDISTHSYENDDEYAAMDEDHDDLGYYPDGTQRTLTDEQVRIFRQSELKEMLKNWQKRKATAEIHGVEPVFSVSDPARDKKSAKASVPVSAVDAGDGANDDGETSDSAATPSDQSKKRKKIKTGASGPRKEPKPDLRKRTWDVVDTGLDSLEYD